MTTASGLRRLIATLADVLAEAVPTGWDDSEDSLYRLESEGLEGLVDFIEGHRHEVYFMVKAPARRLDLYPVSPSERDGSFRVSSLQVELDVAVLDLPGAANRLPQAFEHLAELIEPFYAEARIIEGVARDPRRGLVHNPWVEQYPFWANEWWGLPVKAPFAAALGTPYRRLWPVFGSDDAARMAIEIPTRWRRDMPQLQWAVPEGLPNPSMCISSRSQGPKPPIRSCSSRSAWGSS